MVKRSDKKSTQNTVHSLQATTKQSNCSKVKRKLIVIDSEEEENNEQVARTNSATNNQNPVQIQNDLNIEIVNNTEESHRTTRQTTLRSSKKKKMFMG